MDNFSSLYDFIDLARANHKYPENTANNLKSALKIFEKELNDYERKSINMIKDSIEEIFRSVVIANKQKSIISLNTYKARLLKVIEDYEKYGSDPSKIRNWTIKTRKFTPLLINKDKTDKENINLSNSIQEPVENPHDAHKIELHFSDSKLTMHVPKKLNAKEARMAKDIIDSLVEKD